MISTRTGILWAAPLCAMLIVCSLIHPARLSAGESEFCLAGLEATLIPDRELDEIRGGYSGFYFSLDFSGSWDHLSQTGSSAGQLAYHTEQGDFTVSVNNAPESTSQTSLPVSSQQSLKNGSQEVRMTAYVGDISQSAGAIQICQVPGSNNVVTTIMNMQFTIINVTDQSKLAQLKTILPGFSGS